MDILKQVKENGNMLDFMSNLINNINFYVKHRDELADIGFSNEFFKSYLDKLYFLVDNFDKLPNWFKEYDINKLLSSNFPYVNSFLGFTWSLYDLVYIVCNVNDYKNKNDIKDIYPINSSVAVVLFNTDNNFEKRNYLTKNEVKDLITIK